MRISSNGILLANQNTKLKPSLLNEVTISDPQKESRLYKSRKMRSCVRQELDFWALEMCPPLVVCTPACHSVHRCSQQFDDAKHNLKNKNKFVPYRESEPRTRTSPSMPWHIIHKKKLKSDSEFGGYLRLARPSRIYKVNPQVTINYKTIRIINSYVNRLFRKSLGGGS